MKQAGGRNRILLFIAGVIVFSVTLFYVCYLFDNKYTANDPLPENGLLTLDEQSLSEHPVVFLTHGWEIYRDRLLAPTDFATGLRPDEYVYLGQYGGFEGSDVRRSPHGSATYRLNITIPSVPAAYTLELPEIYSAYTLYINGVNAEQFGDPDPAGYRPETGNSSASFLAQNRIEIIVAVSDYSHMYSGMVYPPAFGIPQAVSGMIQIRLIVRAAVCTVALALALFFLAVGFFMKKDRAMLLFGAVCLCFMGYVCYPLVKTVFRGGLWWYGVENFCFCAMLLLAMLLQRNITGDSSSRTALSLASAQIANARSLRRSSSPRRTRFAGLRRGFGRGLRTRFDDVFVGFGVVVCACSLLRTALPSGVPGLLAGYSLLLDFYMWAAAVFLTVSVLRSVGKDTQYGVTIISGILVYDSALVMDRLLPMFEPIRFGWFTEIGGFAIVLTLGIVVGQETLRQYRDKLALEGKIAGIENLVEMQRNYYPVILESVDKALRASHDLRHHVGVIRGLVSSGKHDELMEYTSMYAAESTGLSSFTFCENYVVDVILRHFAAIAQREGIRYEVDAAIPETLPIDNADLCTVISNLLENALEACAYVNAPGFGANGKSIRVTVKQVKSSLTILVDNSFDGTVRTRGGVYLSRKRHNREGVGLASARFIAEKYGGGAEFMPDYERKTFRSEIVMKSE